MDGPTITIFGRHIYCSSEMKRGARVEAYNELPHSGKMDNSAPGKLKYLKQSSKEENSLDGYSGASSQGIQK